MTEEVKQEQDDPVAYINVEQRKLEWAKPIVWETPTVANLPKIPLYTTLQQGCDECGVGGGYALYCVACAEKFFVSKEWIGLTDEEKAQFVVAYYPSNWDRKTAVTLMSDYEKYLKEKNT